jgi:hypothetical protein
MAMIARYGNPRADQLERELADCQRNATSAELQHADESKRFSAATLRFIKDRTEWQNEKAALRESGAMQVHFQRVSRDQIKAAEGDVT